MRSFTRGWVSGDLTEEECEAAVQAYRARLSAIAPRAPAESVSGQSEPALAQSPSTVSTTWAPRRSTAFERAAAITRV
jgi:hypothetical protein